MIDELLNSCECIWNKLKLAHKKIVLYGMGNGADIIIDELDKIGVTVSGVFASDDFVRGQIFRGFKVKKYSDFKEEFGDFIVLVAFGTFRDEVIENIKRISEETETYAVDVPVYGDNIFNEKFANDNKDKIEKVYNMLADEKSKYIYKNIIKFKYTGKIEYLFNAQSEHGEKYDVLNLTDSETYLDLGAYRGDTVAEFIENVNDYKNIIAVEPDKKTFDRLMPNVGNYKNIKCVNVCVADYKGQIEFNNAAGRNSSKGKGKFIECDTVDNIADGDEITFIKADVEGMEKEMLKGAVSVIKNFKPKMDISCYHRTEDIFFLPLLVNEIRDDYKIYIRHFKYVPMWDTSFYFV